MAKSPSWNSHLTLENDIAFEIENAVGFSDLMGQQDHKARANERHARRPLSGTFALARRAMARFKLAGRLVLFGSVLAGYGAAATAQSPGTTGGSGSPGGGWGSSITTRTPPGTAPRKTTGAGSTANRSGPGRAVAAPSPQVRTAPAAHVVALTLSGDDQRTRVALDVTRPIVASMFVLTNPNRAIVDVPNLAFRLPPAAGRAGHGLISAYRYGQFEAGRSRIVIDVTSAVRIENAAFTPPVGRKRGRLTFDLVPVAHAPAAARPVAPVAAAAVAGAAVPGAGAVQPPAARAAGGARLRTGRFDDATQPPHAAPSAPGAGPVGKRRQPRLPVVVLDPGHGGIDPGTVSTTNLTEKAVVLAVSLHVRSLLVRGGRYQVKMTRDKDVFVSLKNRLAFSQAAGAKLFISIHADALAEKDQVASVKGATIYTLSERASDAAALRLAEKENAADLLAGLDTVPASDEDQVRSILIDLVRRETANFSTLIRRQLVRSMKGSVPLSREPERSAAFTVLKQADTPAVLIELGYMSNPEDLARLSRLDWQRKAAASIVAAVDAYFSRSSAQHQR